MVTVHRAYGKTVRKSCLNSVLKPKPSLLEMIGHRTKTLAVCVGLTVVLMIIFSDLDRNGLPVGKIVSIVFLQELLNSDFS